MSHGKPVISLIAAISRNGVIGKNNTLPWRLPADLQHFKKITTGHCIITGRKNYEDIGRPLPNRTNIIVTRQPEFSAPGCVVAHSVEEALDHCAGEQEIFVIGGAVLYAETLPLAGKLYITHVDAEIDGDTCFPAVNWDEWHQIARQPHCADDKNPYDYVFAEYLRKGRP